MFAGNFKQKRCMVVKIYLLQDILEIQFIFFQTTTVSAFINLLIIISCSEKNTNIYTSICSINFLIVHGLRRFTAFFKCLYLLAFASRHSQPNC